MVAAAPATTTAEQLLSLTSAHKIWCPVTISDRAGDISTSKSLSLHGFLVLRTKLSIPKQADSQRQAGGSPSSTCKNLAAVSCRCGMVPAETQGALSSAGRSEPLGQGFKPPFSPWSQEGLCSWLTALGRNESDPLVISSFIFLIGLDWSVISGPLRIYLFYSTFN